jgi:hypothetical protein
MTLGDEGPGQMEPSEGAVSLDGLGSRGLHSVFPDSNKGLCVPVRSRATLALTELLKSLGNGSGKVDEEVVLGSFMLATDFGGRDNVDPPPIDLVNARGYRPNQVVIGDGDDVEASRCGPLNDLFGAEFAV